jgi:hypothetical protein
METTSENSLSAASDKLEKDREPIDVKRHIQSFPVSPVI